MYSRRSEVVSRTSFKTLLRRTFFELDGTAMFMPVERIHCKFVPALDILQNEQVLVVCPLPRK